MCVNTMSGERANTIKKRYASAVSQNAPEQNAKDVANTHENINLKECHVPTRSEFIQYIPRNKNVELL